VRQVLRAGKARQALLMLSLYGRRFPNGALGPEATVLTVEALLRAGDREAAAALAERVISGAPQSQHAKIIRALIGRAHNP
jgi:hypothetical protein